MNVTDVSRDAAADADEAERVAELRRPVAEKKRFRILPTAILGIFGSLWATLSYYSASFRSFWVTVLGNFRWAFPRPFL